MSRGKFTAMMAMYGLMLSSVDNKMHEFEIEQKQQGKKMSLRKPKGTKHYYFDSDGKFYFLPLPNPNITIIFECFAINDKNAVHKYNKKYNSK